MRHAMIGFVGVMIAGSASAQGNFDGTWTGQAGQWAITLTVAGTKAKYFMTCGGIDGAADFTLGADGAVNFYVTSGAGRRQITGKLPTIQVPPAVLTLEGKTIAQRHRLFVPVADVRQGMGWRRRHALRPGVNSTNLPKEQWNGGARCDHFPIKRDN